MIPDFNFCHTPDIHCDIPPIFLKGNLFFIADDIPAARCQIWLWRYCRNVIDLHRLDLLMVVSEITFSFSAVAPTALSACVPTSFGVMPWLGNPKSTIAIFIPSLVSLGVTCHHFPSDQYSHKSEVSSPPFPKIWLFSPRARNNFPVKPDFFADSLLVQATVGVLLEKNYCQVL